MQELLHRQDQEEKDLFPASIYTAETNATALEVQRLRNNENKRVFSPEYRQLIHRILLINAGKELDEAGALSLLIGPPGTGKTELATEVAVQLATQPDLELSEKQLFLPIFTASGNAAISAIELIGSNHIQTKPLTPLVNHIHHLAEAGFSDRATLINTLSMVIETFLSYQATNLYSIEHYNAVIMRLLAKIGIPLTFPIGSETKVKGELLAAYIDTALPQSLDKNSIFSTIQTLHKLIKANVMGLAAFFGGILVLNEAEKTKVGTLVEGLVGLESILETQANQPIAPDVLPGLLVDSNFRVIATANIVEDIAVHMQRRFHVQPVLATAETLTYTARVLLSDENGNSQIAADQERQLTSFLLWMEGLSRSARTGFSINALAMMCRLLLNGASFDDSLSLTLDKFSQVKDLYQLYKRKGRRNRIAVSQTHGLTLQELNILLNKEYLFRQTSENLQQAKQFTPIKARVGLDGKSIEIAITSPNKDDITGDNKEFIHSIIELGESPNGYAIESISSGGQSVILTDNSGRLLGIVDIPSGAVLQLMQPTEISHGELKSSATTGVVIYGEFYSETSGIVVLKQNNTYSIVSFRKTVDAHATKNTVLPVSVHTIDTIELGNSEDAPNAVLQGNTLRITIVRNDRHYNQDYTIEVTEDGSLRNTL